MFSDFGHHSVAKRPAVATII